MVCVIYIFCGITGLWCVEAKMAVHIVAKLSSLLWKTLPIDASINPLIRGFHLTSVHFKVSYHTYVGVRLALMVVISRAGAVFFRRSLAAGFPVLIYRHQQERHLE